MRRWLCFTFCALLGGVMLICGLLVPAHLRAVDVSVVQAAGKSGPALIERGRELVAENQLGAAELLLVAAQELKLSGAEAFGASVADLAANNPELRVWGAPPPGGVGWPTSPGDFRAGFQDVGTKAMPGLKTEPVTELILRRENRQRALDLLGASTVLGVKGLLNCRDLTNTVIFSPSHSASGQAFDVAIAVTGLLLNDGHLTSGLTDALFNAVLRAKGQIDSRPLERMTLDLMSLGERMSWGQLTTFVAHIEDPETLRVLSDRVRNADEQLPVLFSAVELSGNPSRVGNYLTDFSQTGPTDLGTALRFGAGGVKELLQSDKRLSRASFRGYLPAFAGLDLLTHFGATVCLSLPRGSLAAKWLLYFLSGFFIAAAMHFARRPVTALERPLEVRGFHLARESLFALGYLLVVLLLSEPFLSQGGQKVEPHFRLRLPTVGGAVHAGAQIIDRTFMNQVNLLTLLLFFVLQGLIYTACVIKLAEIRRQKVPAQTKLKLLENEEHLFDAGLYLGFVGTIVSLILVSMGIAHFSLMAAYSSTSFGIVFVSFFKIFHLRGARRTLLLQAESALSNPVRTPVTPTLAPQS